jgi:hypothetical protein
MWATFFDCFPFCSVNRSDNREIPQPWSGHSLFLTSRSPLSSMADTQINHQDARNYWQGIDADVNGMLGGYPYISKVDLQGSKNFLAKLGIGGRHGRKVARAVDCGAGSVRFAISQTIFISGQLQKANVIALLRKYFPNYF